MNDGRRRLLRDWGRLLAAAGAGPLLAAGPAGAQPASGAGASRSLVAYFSRTGHTRQVALAVAAATGAELFEIEPETPFPAGYQDTVDLNVRHRAAGVFPAVQRLIPGLDRYGVVFLGYPIWAVDLPPLLVPFLQRQDFAGKVLAPFCTSAMSGLADTERRLRRLCPDARVLPGLGLPGGGRGHNTLVTGIDPEHRRQAAQWARQGLALARP